MLVYETDLGKFRSLNVPNPAPGLSATVIAGAASDIRDSGVFAPGKCGLPVSLRRAVLQSTDTDEVF